MELHCWDLALLGTYDPFLFSGFSLLERECLSCACPTIELQKLITCLVLQVYIWRGIFLKNESHQTCNHIYMRFET